jgi:hypothetical protein
MEGSGSGLVYGTIMAPVWKDRTKTTINLRIAGLRAEK